MFSLKDKVTRYAINLAAILLVKKVVLKQPIFTKQIVFYSLAEVGLSTLLGSTSLLFVSKDDNSRSQIRDKTQKAWIENFCMRNLIEIAKPLKIPFVETTTKILQWAIPSNIVFSHLYIPQTIIHEAGHYYAMKGLLKNVDPEIIVYPTGGGRTEWIGGNPGIITSLFNDVFYPIGALWSQISYQNSLALVYAAGPISAISAATLQLQAGLASHYEFGRVFIISSLTDFLEHIAYALSDFATNRKHGDFYKIWELENVHPILSASVIAAIPTIILYRFFKRNK